jgi:signal transduction histidine kinase
VRVEAGVSILEVADRGPGIPPGSESRLFQPYYTTKPGGTGLGLAISAGIAREFGGTLTASNRDGGGALFQLRLPRVGAPTLTPIEADRPRAAVHATDDAAGARESRE